MVFEGEKEGVTVTEMDPDAVRLGDGVILPVTLDDIVMDGECEGLTDILAEIEGLRVDDADTDMVGEPEMLVLREALAVMEAEGVLDEDALWDADTEGEVLGDEDVDEVELVETEGVALTEGDVEVLEDVDGDVDGLIELDAVMLGVNELVGEKEGLVEVVGVGDVDGGIIWQQLGYKLAPQALSSSP